jgi:outer membrane protein OmpA-like peptidoglycan-associated protein
MAGTAIPYKRGGVRVTIGQPNTVAIPPAIFRCRLTGLLFDTNKTFLLPMAFRGMKVLKKLYAAHSNLGILVNGHTDRQGGAGYNLTLSEERAKSIEAFLRTMSTSGSSSTRAGPARRRGARPRTRRCRALSACPRTAP